MLQLIYIFLFTIIAFLAISNLIQSLMTLNRDSYSTYPPKENSAQNLNKAYSPSGKVPHPELLDEQGKPINEPLLVMRSVNVEDAREQLDAIYKSSPGETHESDPEN